MPLEYLPTTAISNVTRTAMTAQGGRRSPFTGSEQIQDWGGKWWRYEIDFWPQSGAEAKALGTFFTKLNGRENEFLFIDPNEVKDLSKGVARVNGSGQTGSTLSTDGWTVSGTVMEAGDFFNYGTDDDVFMYRLTEDAVNDGSGIVTLTFWPPLRHAVVDFFRVHTDDPECRLRLTGPVPDQMNALDQSVFSITAEGH